MPPFGLTLTTIGSVRVSLLCFLPPVPAGTQVARTPVIGSPLSEPIMYVMVSVPLPGSMFVITGGSGTPGTMTELDNAEDGPTPTAFLATTVHVYVLPPVTSLIVSGDLRENLLTALAPPFEDAHDAW